MRWSNKVAGETVFIVCCVLFTWPELLCSLDYVQCSQKGVDLLVKTAAVGAVLSMLIAVVVWFKEEQRNSSVSLQAPSQSNLVPFRPGDSSKIHLKLRRSQRLTIFGNPVFAMNARAEIPPEASTLVVKYSLGKMIVYDSTSRRRHQESAYAHFTEGSAEANRSIGRALWKNARGIASAAMMALSLRVTVNSLIRGQYVECKSLSELLSAEQAFIDACQSLRAYIETAVTFDGREELLEF